MKPRILHVCEKGVLREISRNTGGCKTQNYDLFSSINISGYQSNDDEAEGILHAQ